MCTGPASMQYKIFHTLEGVEVVLYTLFLFFYSYCTLAKHAKLSKYECTDSTTRWAICPEFPNGRGLDWRGLANSIL